jgi:hypothetical protein
MWHRKDTASLTDLTAIPALRPYSVRIFCRRPKQSLAGHSGFLGARKFILTTSEDPILSIGDTYAHIWNKQEAKFGRINHDYRSFTQRNTDGGMGSSHSSYDKENQR